MKERISFFQRLTQRNNERERESEREKRVGVLFGYNVKRVGQPWIALSYSNHSLTANTIKEHFNPVQQCVENADTGGLHVCQCEDEGYVGPGSRRNT